MTYWRLLILRFIAQPKFATSPQSHPGMIHATGCHQRTLITLYQMDYTLELVILRHLLDNPQAMDTLKGIARFWILQKKVSLDVEEVSQALQNLVNEGLISELHGHTGAVADESKLYRLNADRLDEIRHQVGDAESDRDRP